MLGSNAPIAFLATTQADRARTFYADTLGLRLLDDDQFSIVFAVGDNTLRIQKVSALTPQPFTSLGWMVEDIRGVVKELAGRQVVFERYPFLAQDDPGIWATPGGAAVAWFKDPDGNLLSLTQVGVA